MTKPYAHVTLSALALCGCAEPEPELSDIPIACRLDGMSPEDRAREGVLLREHLDRVAEVRERDDGYSYRYPADAALFVRMAELVSLEHRCCPFLTFALEWPGADADPWLHVGGGERAKEFIAATFGTDPS